jgi:protein-tyrosine phosphatase
MAEAIFNHKVKQAGLEIGVDSCGTAAYHIGQKPDPRTIDAVLQNNMAIDHSGRQLSLEDYYKFDYIMAMDRSNLTEINNRCPDDSKSHIGLIRDFDPQPGNGEVPDPYYGGSDGFEKVFQLLDRSSEALLKHITNS